MNSKNKTGAIVIGGSLTGLSTIRCLANLDIPIELIITDTNDIAHHSKFVTEHYNLREFQHHPEALIDFLEHKIEKWKGWVLFPTGDESLAILSSYLDRLSSSYVVMAAPWEQTRKILSKDLTYKAAEEIGINIPYLYGYASLGECINENIKFPVVVKPIDSRKFVGVFGVKLFVATNKTELLDCIGKLEEFSLSALIMDLIPGPDNHFYNYSVYIDRRGEPVAELTMRKLRKSPPFYGVCRVAENINSNRLKEPTIELLRHIGWRGIANVEYKLDPRDGKYRLMEINGRCFLMQGLAYRAGINYPLLAWQEYAIGKRVSAYRNNWNGVWINLTDDLYFGSFYRNIENLSLKQYLSTYRRPKTYAVWSRTDPTPFIVHFYKGVRKALSAAINSQYRDKLHSHVQGMPMDID